MLLALGMFFDPIGPYEYHQCLLTCLMQAAHALPALSVAIGELRRVCGRIHPLCNLRIILQRTILRPRELGLVCMHLSPSWVKSATQSVWLKMPLHKLQLMGSLSHGAAQLSRVWGLTCPPLSLLPPQPCCLPKCPTVRITASLVAQIHSKCLPTWLH